MPEPAERFSVTLGAITGKAGSQVSVESGKGTANADIAENDVVTVSVSGDERVTEGGSATYTISLDSAESTQAITVDYSTIDRTALAGTDYTAASGTVTIAAGDTSATVTVATTDNEDDEANRYFEFRMSNPQGGGGPTPMLSTAQFVQTTIVDNDGDPSSILLTVDKTSFGESAAAQTVNVTATLEGGTLAENTRVAVTLGGSATKGSTGDYTATTLGNITITAGESSGTASFTVTPVDDQVVEGDETIELKGAVAHLDVTPATITITDDDTATVSITGPAGMVAEGSSAEFTVTLSHAVASQIVVTWSVGSTAQTPASADDYSPNSGSVIFPAGSAAGATKTITMAIADDGADEEQETFTVTLGTVIGDLASRVSVDSSKSSADASIATGEMVTVTLLGPRAFANESRTDHAVYHVLLSGPVNADIQVDIATADGTANGCFSIGNGCSRGQTGDYGRVSKTLTIGPSNDTEHNQRKSGVTWTWVEVNLTGNPRSDPDETFTISLSNLRGGGTTPVVLGNSSVTTTIKSTPLAFSVSGPEFVDEGTKARFIVTRNVDMRAGEGARVSYATSDGTATAGTDYTAASGRLEMALLSPDAPPTIEEMRWRYSDWEILVPVTADNVDESDETFTLTLSSPEIYYAGHSLITPAALGTAKATTTIRDRAMVVSVGGPETVVEGQNADFTVSLSRAPTANLMVNYQTYSALAPSRLATSGEDYTAQSGALTFVPGETSKRVRVPILTDATREPIEYFRLLLSSPMGGGGLTPTLGTSEATMGIVDAAGPLLGATLTVTPDHSVGEGDGAATDFTVKVDLDCCTTFDEDATVTISFTGTATNDYTPVTGTLTIPASAATGSGTLRITPVEDAIVEGDETIVVNGSVTGFVVFPDTITITDNDTATVGITGPSAEVAEGSNAEFTVTLSDEIARELTVAWSAPLITDTAVAADMGATSGAVTFAAGSAAGATQTISIPITDDTEAEPAETFTVTLGAVGGHLSDLVTVDPAAASATIPMDEEFAHITLSFNPEYVQEGSDVEVTFTATRNSTVGDHTLVWSGGWSSQTARDGTDHTRRGGGNCDSSRNPDYFLRELASDLRIAPGESSASTTITFHICADDLDEPNETIVWSATVAGATVTDAVLTIGDPEAITLSASPDTIAENAGATDVTVTATLSEARTVDTVVDLSLGGTADAPADYTATALSSVTIPKGETTASGKLTITPIDDGVAEADETIIVSGTSGARPVSSADITIADDPTTITLSVDPEYVQEGQYAARVTLTATRDGTVGDHRIAVDVGVGGTATDGTDYTIWGLPGTGDPPGPHMHIAPGKDSATFTLTFSVYVDDPEHSDEGSETVILSGAASGAVVRDTVVTIGDPESIALSVSPDTIPEDAGATEVTVTASLSAARVTDTVVTIKLDGSAENPADYAATSLASVTIPRGQTSGSGTLTITPVEDTVLEIDETITVSGSSGARPVTPADITLTDIFTDDPAYPDSYTLTASPTTIGEGDGATQITFTAEIVGNKRFATNGVEIYVYPNSDRGTRVATEDYTISGHYLLLTIPAGGASASGTLTITPVNDDIVEGRREHRLHQPRRRRIDNLGRADRHSGRRRRATEHNAERQPVGPARGQFRFHH